jgi:hypothetical protein
VFCNVLGKRGCWVDLGRGDGGGLGFGGVLFQLLAAINYVVLIFLRLAL